MIGHRIGEERYSVTTSGGLSSLVAHFEYRDRGVTVPLDARLDFGADFTPTTFEAHGKSYRYFAVDAAVPQVKHAKPSNASFTLEGMAPVSAQGLLVRYWLAHGRPPAITLQPSGDVVRVREYRTNKVADGLNIPTPLRHFAIQGVVWGTESVWLYDTLDVAAVVTTAGTFPFEATDERQVRDVAPFIVGARQDRLDEAAEAMRAVSPVQQGTFALVGARLVDGTGHDPIDGAVVLVRNGRIEAAGDRSKTAIPRGVPQVDVSGRTILPGLWDMHAHVGQIDWGPVYLASGVTTARDMGGELDIVTALRDAWGDGRALGPRLLLAGLVDGPGADAFGTVTAADPAEGKQVVARYKQAGFQQMKLYSLLDRPTVQAVIDEAHAAGMTVTGHIPNGLTLRDAIAMGMDHVAHLVVRGVPGSGELADTIAFLKAHRTVMDPTISWNELLGRSAQTPIAAFQPGIVRVAPPLRRLLESANGGSLTPEQARDRLARSLAVIKALHDAGVPIVAGTDKGVPGVSVAREVELYVQAGLSPMEAIRAATAVPAEAMGLAGDSGTLIPGSRADLIVVDGNPLERISDIRKVGLVCTNGRLYVAAPLWRLGGFN